MYRNNSNPGGLGNQSLELSTMVDGTDVFNSELLYKFTQYPTHKLKEYEVTKKGLNPNSLAKILYGSHKYSWILILMNPGVPIDQYVFGSIIKYPDLSEIRSYINE